MTAALAAPARATSEQVLALAGDDDARTVFIELAGKWKHGWIPLDAIAEAIKAKRLHSDGSGKWVHDPSKPFSHGKSRINANEHVKHAMAPKGKAAIPRSETHLEPKAAVRMKAVELRPHAARGDKTAQAELARRGKLHEGKVAARSQKLQDSAQDRSRAIEAKRVSGEEGALRARSSAALDKSAKVTGSSTAADHRALADQHLSVARDAHARGVKGMADNHLKIAQTHQSLAKRIDAEHSGAAGRTSQAAEIAQHGKTTHVVGTMSNHDEMVTVSKTNGQHRVKVDGRQHSAHATHDEAMTEAHSLVPEHRRADTEQGAIDKAKAVSAQMEAERKAKVAAARTGLSDTEGKIAAQQASHAQSVKAIEQTKALVQNPNATEADHAAAAQAHAAASAAAKASGLHVRAAQHDRLASSHSVSAMDKPGQIAWARTTLDRNEGRHGLDNFPTTDERDRAKSLLRQHGVTRKPSKAEEAGSRPATVTDISSRRAEDATAGKVVLTGHESFNLTTGQRVPSSGPSGASVIRSSSGAKIAETHHVDISDSARKPIGKQSDAELRANYPEQFDRRNPQVRAHETMTDTRRAASGRAQQIGNDVYLGNGKTGSDFAKEHVGSVSKLGSSAWRAQHKDDSTPHAGGPFKTKAEAQGALVLQHESRRARTPQADTKPDTSGHTVHYISGENQHEVHNANGRIVSQGHANRASAVKEQKRLNAGGNPVMGTHAILPKDRKVTAHEVGGTMGEIRDAETGHIVSSGHTSKMSAARVANAHNAKVDARSAKFATAPSMAEVRKASTSQLEAVISSPTASAAVKALAQRILDERKA